MAAIINSVISLTVYMRIIGPTYVNEPEQKKAVPASVGIKLVWITTFVLTIIVGLSVQWFLI